MMPDGNLDSGPRASAERRGIQPGPAVATARSYWRGQPMFYDSSGTISPQAGDAHRTFAGFVHRDSGAVAAGALISVRRPDRVLIPDTGAAVAHRGQVIYATTDDTTVTFATANSTKLGKVLDAVASSHYRVDTRL